MKCPICGGSFKINATINAAENVVYRRRYCIKCGRKFKTIERIISTHETNTLESFALASRIKSGKYPDRSRYL